ncbi:MAG: M48 family metalloprotease [Euryarchaeota archaeon]|nr:M48 family metalloprotease [Euryarchaeota archaeon]
MAVRLSKSRRVVAQAEGMLIDGIPSGIIRVNSVLPDVLTDRELEFVLGHEVSHIHRNHLASRKLFSAIRSWAEARAKQDSRFDWLLAGYDMFQTYKVFRGELPPVPRITSEQELEADRDGILLAAGDVNAAKSALLKLVGGNADAPSHTWSIRGVPLSTMTIRERLAHLDGIR